MKTRYETLRRAALGLEPAADHGLALVIHRGLVAWMAVWAELEPAPAAAAAQSRVPAATAPELVQALTTLALGAIGG